MKRNKISIGTCEVFLSQMILKQIPKWHTQSLFYTKKTLKMHINIYIKSALPAIFCLYASDVISGRSESLSHSTALFIDAYLLIYIQIIMQITPVTLEYISIYSRLLCLLWCAHRILANRKSCFISVGCFCFSLM